MASFFAFDLTLPNRFLAEAGSTRAGASNSAELDGLDAKRAFLVTNSLVPFLLRSVYSIQPQADRPVSN